MATLRSIISEMLQWDDADHIRLNDGADTWDLECLYDACEDDDGDYALGPNGSIYRIDDDGYMKSPPVYMYEDCEEHRELGECCGDCEACSHYAEQD